MVCNIVCPMTAQLHKILNRNKEKNGKITIYQFPGDSLRPHIPAFVDLCKDNKKRKTVPVTRDT